MDEKTYKPELLPRQGELNAWLLTAAAVIGLIILGMRSAIPYWAWVMFGLLLLSAVSISLGNWMDRKTELRVSSSGVEFQNGLRHINLTWAEIQSISTAPARWGTSIQVLAEKSHFAFSTIGEMQFQGQVRARTGFSAGKEILELITQKAGLTRVSAAGTFTTYSRP